jgi:hypothetical protein
MEDISHLPYSKSLSIDAAQLAPAWQYSQSDLHTWAVWPVLFCSGEVCLYFVTWRERRVVPGVGLLFSVFWAGFCVAFSGAPLLCLLPSRTILLAGGLFLFF